MVDPETNQVFGYNNTKYEVTMTAMLDWDGGIRNASDTYSFSFYISYERHKRLAPESEETSQEECEATLPTAPEQPELNTPAEVESTPTDESEETAV